MAARKNPHHKQRTKDKIQATQLIHRLQRHIFAEPGQADYEAALMSRSQVAAAATLLKKVLPDLAAQKVDIAADTRIEVFWVGQGS